MFVCTNVHGAKNVQFLCAQMFMIHKMYNVYVYKCPWCIKCTMFMCTNVNGT